MNFAGCILFLRKCFRIAYRKMEKLGDMANAMLNNNLTRRLFFLSFLILIAADPTSNNETEQLSTLSLGWSNETEQFFTSDLALNNETEQLTTPSLNWSNETEQRFTSDLPLNNETVWVSTASPNGNNETELFSTLSPNHNQTVQLRTRRPHRNKVTVHLRAPSPYRNRATLETVCTNSSIRVHMRFPRPFRGVAYSKENLHNSTCSFFSLPSSKAKEAVLEFPLESCGNEFRQMPEGVLVHNTILIQQHRMIPTRFDTVANVSCMLDFPYEIVEPTEIVPDNTTIRKAVVWLEVLVGSDLFPDEQLRPENFIESALYLVLEVADMRVNRDLLVRNCIAHDRRFITNGTNLYQMSDFYGCPSNSSMLDNFIVTNQTGRLSHMMAYAMVKNFTLFAKDQLFITCGVNLCQDTCQPKCDQDESQRYRAFTKVVLKKIVRRPVGATTPSTLQILEEQSERIKRSIRDTFNSVLRASRSILSDLVQGSDRTQMPETTEASTEETVFVSDSEGNNGTTAFTFETTSTSMETIAWSEEIDLNQGMLLTGLDLSTETSTSMMETHSQSITPNKHQHKVHNRIFSGYILSNSLAAEIFVFAIFCLMVLCYICFLHTKADKNDSVTK